MPKKRAKRVLRSCNWRVLFRFADLHTKPEPEAEVSRFKNCAPPVLSSSWQTIPNDLLYEIFSYLNAKDQKASTLVCQGWCACGSQLLLGFGGVAVGQRTILAPYELPRDMITHPELCPAFVKAVSAPGSRLPAFVHSLCFGKGSIINLRGLQSIIQELPNLRVLHFDHAYLALGNADSPYPGNEPTPPPIPVDRRTSLDVLHINGLNPRFLDPMPSLWYILMMFSSIEQLTIAAAGTMLAFGPPRTRNIDLACCAGTIYVARPKVRVRRLSLSGCFIELADEQLHHAIDFAGIHKLEISLFMADREGPHLAGFLAEHSRSWRIVELIVRCSWGFELSLLDRSGRWSYHTMSHLQGWASVHTLLQTSDSRLEELRRTLPSSCSHLRKFTLAYLAPLSTTDELRSEYLHTAWNGHLKAFVQSVPSLEDITLDLCCQVEWPDERRDVHHDPSVLLTAFLEKLDWSLIDDCLKDHPQRINGSPTKRLTFAFNNQELAKKSLWWLHVDGKHVPQPAPPGWQDIVKSKLSYPTKERISLL